MAGMSTGEVAEVRAGEMAGVSQGGRMIEINPPEELSIATYNVQNLFDFIDDPQRDEGEFTPNVGDWSRSTYEARVAAIAEALLLIDADIVTLQEVENEVVLEALADHLLSIGGRDYQFRATSSTRDPRGIALGVLSVYPFHREIGRPISQGVNCANGETLDGSRPEARPIYEINFWTDESGGGGGGGEMSLTLLVNHWKSRASGDYPCRVREHHERGAMQIKSLLIDWLTEEPTRAVVVLGDFNAEESEPSLSEQINAYLNRAELNEVGVLYNLWGELGVTASSSNNATNSTYRYDGDWFRLDHILVSQPMVSDEGGAWRVKSVELIRDQRLLNNGRPYGWSSRQTQGYSDHLPLKMNLVLNR